MEIANTIIEIKHFVECPHCHNSKSRIDHLFTDEGKTRSWGPWYCYECGGAYSGMAKGKEIHVEKLDKKMNHSIVFLKNGNILLAVKGMYFDGEFDRDHDRYFYEEHTCPINYLHKVEMVINLNDGDTDPHGIFEFLGSIPYVDLEKVDDITGLIPNTNPIP